jgi:Zn-dependent peptidase ImmA (M78 family)
LKGGEFLVADWIYKEVERVIRAHGTRDPFELLDCMDAITIMSDKYGRKGLKGYCYEDLRTKFAVINRRLNPYEQKVVAGHEAAHLIIHKDEILGSPARMLKDFNIFDDSGKIEYQANLFAADFMLDDDDVLELVQDEHHDFFSTARELYIPPAFLTFKLYSMMRRGYDVRPPMELDSKFLAK